MDFRAILSRALQIATRYRALWIFGFLLALCGGSGGNGGNFNSGDFSNGSNGGQFDNPFETIDPQILIAVGLGLICLALTLLVVGIIVRIVCTSAIIGMVNQIEEEDKVSVSDGWRFGWSRSALRLFLIGLIINIPFGILILFILLAAASPFLLAVFNPDTPALFISGIVAGIGLLLLALLIIFVLSLAVWIWTEFANRYAVLHKKRTFASIGESYWLIQRNFKESAKATVILFGVGILWVIISIFLLVIFLIIAALIGGLPGLLIYWLFNEVWIALLVGIPLFLITLVIPLTFVSGLYLIFQSATWTLIFRNLIDGETPKGFITEKSVDPRGTAVNINPADS